MAAPIHIVSGFYRSGTSAMMQALSAGGLSAAWSPERDAVAAKHADEHYHPNKAGLFEISLDEYENWDFPLSYQDKLIKVMLWGLDRLAVHSGGYRVVIMCRDTEEIRQSYQAFFGRPCSPLTEYSQRLARAQAMLANRRDVLGVDLVNYRVLVESPDLTMIRLRGRGWPIDPLEAAAAVDPEQYRYRLERLTVGI